MRNSVHASEQVVVSCPSNINVSTSSRISEFDNFDPSVNFTCKSKSKNAIFFLSLVNVLLFESMSLSLPSPLSSSSISSRLAVKSKIENVGVVPAYIKCK